MKNAFTLVELLAVMAILGIVAVVTTPVINDIIGDSKNRLNITQSKEILRAAEVWGAKNIIVTGGIPSETSVTIQELVDGGYLSKDVTDLIKKNDKYNACIIKICYKQNQVMYEFDTSGCPENPYERRCA